MSFWNKLKPEFITTSFISKLTNYLLKSKKFTPSQSIICRIIIERNVRNSNTMEKFSRVFDNSKWTDSFIQGPTQHDLESYLKGVLRVIGYLIFLFILVLSIKINLPNYIYESVAYGESKTMLFLSGVSVTLSSFTQSLLYSILKIFVNVPPQTTKILSHNKNTSVFNKEINVFKPVYKNTIVNDYDPKYENFLKHTFLLTSDLKSMRYNKLKLISLIEDRSPASIAYKMGHPYAPYMLKPKSSINNNSFIDLETRLLNQVSRKYPFFMFTEIDSGYIPKLYTKDINLTITNLNIPLTHNFNKESIWLAKNSQSSQYDTRVVSEVNSFKNLLHFKSENLDTPGENIWLVPNTTGRTYNNSSKPMNLAPNTNLFKSNNNNIKNFVTQSSHLGILSSLDSSFEWYNMRYYSLKPSQFSDYTFIPNFKINNVNFNLQYNQYSNTLLNQLYLVDLNKQLSSLQLITNNISSNHLNFNNEFNYVYKDYNELMSHQNIYSLSKFFMSSNSGINTKFYPIINSKFNFDYKL